MLKINTDRAAEYISTNFTLDGTGMRLCNTIFQFWNSHEDGLYPTLSPDAFLLELLDPIGFNESDIQAMRGMGIL